MVFLPWWWNNLDGQWDDPLISHCLERLASFSRVIVFDMRGVGLSDPASLQDLPTLERWMNDAKAVLDAVGSSEAMVIGHGDGGLVAMLLAATYPARTSGLVLVDSYAPFAAEDGYEGWDPEGLDRVLAGFEDFWGTGNPGWVGMVAPSQAHSEEFRDQLARLERQSVSPGAAAALQLTIGHLDVRPILAAISTPTLVLAHQDDRYIPAFFGRYLADHIAGATMVELEGADHLYWVGGADATLDQIERFATGTRAPPRPERVLATVLFTDMAGSTRLAAEVGDQRWGTDFSPPSMDRRAPLPVHVPFVTRLARSASACGLGCTPGRSKSADRTLPAWRSTSVSGCRRSPNPARCSSREPWSTWSSARGCSSPIAASTN